MFTGMAAQKSDAAFNHKYDHFDKWRKEGTQFMLSKWTVWLQNFDNLPVFVWAFHVLNKLFFPIHNAPTVAVYLLKKYIKHAREAMKCKTRLGYAAKIQIWCARQALCMQESRVIRSENASLMCAPSVIYASIAWDLPTIMWFVSASETHD